MMRTKSLCRHECMTSCADAIIVSGGQIEGRQPRWEVFHHIHMISRTVKRMPACSSLTNAESVPGAAGWHVLNGHLAWMLGPLLQIVRCLHSIYSPQVSPSLPLHTFLQTSRYPVVKIFSRQWLLTFASCSQKRALGCLHWRKCNMLCAHEPTDLFWCHSSAAQALQSQYCSVQI